MEALGTWTEAAGKKAVGGLILSLNGGSLLNPVGNLGVTGLQSPTGTLATEIVGHSSWTDIQLVAFNLQFVYLHKNYNAWGNNCQDYTGDLLVAMGLPKPYKTGGILKSALDWVTPNRS